MCDVVLSDLLPEHEAIAYDLLENELKFTDKQIKELRRCRDNHDKNTASEFNWSVYGLGIKAERPNRIFHWDRIPDEQYKALDCPVYIGCDWGTSDPWAIGEAKYYDGALYVHELNYLSENQWRERLSLTELSQIQAEDAGKDDTIGIVSWLFSKLGISKTIPIVTDTNRPLKGALLRRKGYRAIPALKAPGSVLDGIDILLGLKVYYTASSKNIEHEQENYSRKVDKYGVIEEEPEDCDNHHMDQIRYLVLYLVSIGVIKRF